MAAEVQTYHVPRAVELHTQKVPLVVVVPYSSHSLVGWLRLENERLSTMKRLEPLRREAHTIKSSYEMISAAETPRRVGRVGEWTGTGGRR